MEEITHMGGVDLISRRTGNISNTKTQQVFQPKSIFDELELGMEMNTSSKFSHG